MMAQAFPRIAAMGITGVLVSFADTLSEPANRAAIAFRARLRDVPMDGVEEVAVTLASVFLRIAPDQTDAQTLSPLLERLLAERDWYTARLPAGRKLYKIPTAYGGDAGPQLEDAAQRAGLTPEAAVREISGQQLRVLALGYAPGQPYLGTLPPHWDLPRQTDLTPKVPRAALVVAVRQLVLFANASPTGWRQIGQSAFHCFDPDRTHPAVLRPGDLCQFVEVTADRLAEIAHSATDGLGGAEVEVLS